MHGEVIDLAFLFAIREEDVSAAIPQINADRRRWELRIEPLRTGILPIGAGRLPVLF
jgi:hypothetical protein